VAGPPADTGTGRGTVAPTGVFVEFGRSLREHGLVVGSGQLARYCAALAAIDPTDLSDLYWAGRACLLTTADDIAVYDTEFARFFVGIAPWSPPAGDDVAGADAGPPRRGDRDERPLDRGHDETSGGDDGTGEQPELVGAVAASEEVLRTRSLSAWTDQELARLPELMAEIELHLPRRRVRRSRTSDAGTRLDLRRTVHRSMRHEGELLQRAWRRRRDRPRRLVLLIDVSGSMSTHARALLHFAYGLVQTGLGVEVFCFGTRLTRVTDLLGGRDPNRAVALASSAIVDWSGGTRIGDSLSVFLRRWGTRGTVRGSVVLLFSDGLERGDPSTLATHMARLARLTYAIVWLNPLKSDPTYQPLARGMRAALPHVDRLVAADSVDDLARVARLIPKLT
jgi:uncharacterized protein with von Willebrand factor type A (vWA) domain